MSKCIGIDISVNSVKVIELEQKGRPLVTKAFYFPTPYMEEEGSAGEIDSQSFFQQLTSHISVKELSESYIGVNIPSNLVTVNVFKFPKMKKEELKVAAIMEAKRTMVPVPGPDSVFEYILMGEDKTKVPARDDVLVIKADQPCIDRILRMFNAVAGVKVSFISPVCYTLLHLLKQGAPIYQKDVAFIDIGYEAIDIMITKEGRITFFRNIEYGLKDVIKHLAAVMNISLEEAQNVIREQGAPKEGDSHNEQSRSLWESEFKRILHEIRRTAAYYKEQSTGRRIESFLFLGGAVRITGFIPNLVKQLGGECRIFDPCSDKEISIEASQLQALGEDGSLFAPCLSMAISVALATQRKPLVNFLPLELKKKAFAVFRHVMVSIVSMGLLTIVGIGWAGFSINNSSLKKSLKSLEQNIESFGDIVKQRDALKKDKARLQQNNLKVEDVINNRVNITAVLNEVGLLTPLKIHIVSLKIYNQEASLSSQDSRESGGRIPGAGMREKNFNAPTMTSGTGNSTPRSGGNGMPGGMNMSKDDSAEDKFNISIKAACYADYEGAVQLAQIFKKSLEKSSHITEIELTLPELEKMDPVFGGNEDVQLTQMKLREFKIEGGIEKGINEKF